MRITLALVALLLLAAGMAASVVSTCDPAGEKARQATGGQQAPEHCSAFKGPVFGLLFSGVEWTGHVLKSHGEAVTAAFTIVLAISTILLWRATERLYQAGEAQRAQAERAARRQVREMRESLLIAEKNARAAKQSADAAVQSAEASERTVEMMEDTAVRQLRAYVHVKIALARWLDGPHAQFSLEYANAGQTPAYDVQVWSLLVMTNYPSDEPFPDIGQPASHGTLGHGDSARFTKRAPRQLTAEEIDGLKAGSKVIYLTGTITYRDVYRVKRITEFRYEVGGVGGLPEGEHVTMFISREGNKAD